MTGPPPLCWYCARLQEGPDEFNCEAFPDGVPAAIVDMVHDHRLPYPGDRGTLFLIRAGERLPPHLRRIRRGPAARLLPCPDPALEE